MTEELTDHEQILLIRQDIKNLKDSQSDFHKEVRASFDDLKNNYSATLSNHENRIAGLEATRQDFRNKIDMTCQQIKDNRNYDILLTAIGILLVGILIWHIVGYHI